MRQSESQDKIRAALFAFHKEIEPVIKRSKNPHFKSDYAKFEDVIDAVVTPLANNDMIFRQAVDYDDSRIYVETMLLHTSGEWVSSRTPVLGKDAGNPQHMGSGITYAKRYGLQTICCLPTEDDDGNAASKDRPKEKPTVTDEILKSEKSMASISDKPSVAAAIAAVKKYFKITAQQETLIVEVWEYTHKPAEEV